ncbi:MAG: hypothetical protein MUF07_17155 [Steroidobacteraceae bacterium]|jgi:hypothetical protein|nr:hypothetical protein [Steroidobacteraceae bacterium]
MTDTSNETLTWTDVYFKGQEEFIRRWSEMAGGAAQAASNAAASAAGAAASAGNGHGGQDWFAMFSPQFGGGAAGELARRYFGFYDQYLGATRSLWEVLARAMVNPDPSARARAFADGLQALQQPFTQLWSQSASMFGLPGMPAGGGADLFSALSKAWGGGGGELPALGLTRERQESLQRMQALGQQYLQQQAQLMQLWGGIIGDALKLLGERIGQKLAAGEVIQSSKALYDLWIESAEEVYAKVAHGPAYAKAQADLGNTLAKLRTEQRIAIESVSKQYDLPTREELNTVHRRLRDLKAELRRVNAKLEAAQKPAPRKATRKGK